ncbi:MAG: hypothetical protein WBW16_14200 [Bacteroidota bacterium]
MRDLKLWCTAMIDTIAEVSGLVGTMPALSRRGEFGKVVMGIVSMSALASHRCRRVWVERFQYAQIYKVIWLRF